MLRKMLLATILTMTITIAIPHVAIAKTTHTTHTYRREFAICYDVSIKDNIAYLATGDGNNWMIECDDIDIGDIYRITFDTHNNKARDFVKHNDSRSYGSNWIFHIFKNPRTYNGMVLEKNLLERFLPS